jgi:hypothetical protein
MANGRKVYQIDIKHTNIFRVQDTPKFSQIGIFGPKVQIPSGNPGVRGSVAKNRVTGLDEFSHIWRLFSIGSLTKLTEVAHNFCSAFSRGK